MDLFALLFGMWLTSIMCSLRGSEVCNVLGNKKHIVVDEMFREREMLERRMLGFDNCNQGVMIFHWLEKHNNYHMHHKPSNHQHNKTRNQINGGT